MSQPPKQKGKKTSNETMRQKNSLSLKDNLIKKKEAMDKGMK
jgi:hypothetical protein